jgi:hypothetical protein
MRDILSKLDTIITESALNSKDPKGDYQAKSQALDELEQDPVVAADPELSAAVDQRRADLEKEAESAGVLEVGDAFGISFNEDFEIETEIVGFLEDGIVIDLDETAISHLQENNISFIDGEVIYEEKIKGVDGKACWKGKRYAGKVKKADGTYKDKCVPVGESQFEGSDSGVGEAKYQGREVPLGKKMAGDVKKSKVYVRKPNGNIVKVNFGDKKMRIKKSNPARRKSFRARHNCKNPGPRWKARYWSCRSW